MTATAICLAETYDRAVSKYRVSTFGDLREDRARKMTSGSTTSTSGAVNRGGGAHEPSYTGRAVRRFEDADLLRGHGRFGDDLPVRPDTLHAAILRSPHAHAEVLSVDVAGALAVPGVDCVVTSEDARRWTRPFAVAVKTAMEQWCLAMDRVRYVGEPVAVVLARNRDTAEDALEQIAVEYRPLPPIVDPEAAAWPDAPLLHPAAGSNVISERSFRYGDPETAFAEAEHRISITTNYPRNSATPIECFVVIAEYFPGEEAYEVVANFQGPFAMHPVMAMALGVPGNRLRLRTPAHSGGAGADRDFSSRCADPDGHAALLGDLPKARRGAGGDAGRDALIASSVDERNRGRAFGLKALATTRARSSGRCWRYCSSTRCMSVYAVFSIWRSFPGLLAFFMVLLVTEQPAAVTAQSKIDVSPRQLPKDYWKYLLATALLDLATSVTRF